MTKTKVTIIIILSTVLLMAAIIFMLSVGTAKVSTDTVISIIIEQISGIKLYDSTPAQQIIIWNIRFQRIALALIVGAGLAVSGVCFQTMFKNPLADPFILGVSSGAALGAAAAIISQRSKMLILFAFVGALLSLSLVCLFGWRNKHINSDQHLLLAGVACGALFNAMLSTMMALNSKEMQNIVFWLMGSLNNYIDSLLPIYLVVLSGAVVMMIYARDLDILVLGDEDAKFLGVDVDKVKLVLLLAATLVTGTCVAVSGIIGFIGLIIPHVIRRLVNVGHHKLLIISAIWGAMFLLMSDSITRLISVFNNIPVGIITALFGSPFFLYILYSAGRRQH